MSDKKGVRINVKRIKQMEVHVWYGCVGHMGGGGDGWGITAWFDEEGINCFLLTAMLSRGPFLETPHYLLGPGISTFFEMSF